MEQIKQLHSVTSLNLPSDWVVRPLMSMVNIEKLLQEFRAEVTNASWSFFVWKGINNLASENRDIYQGLNETAISWNMITHSLQTNFFITLGRVFDVDGDSASIHSFLRTCLENIDQFSLDALRDRKLRDQKGKYPDWLDDYLKEAYVPTEENFQRLRGETSKIQKQYEEIYRSIRNKVIAHKDRETLGNVDELFAKTSIGQIESIISFLVQIQEIVFQLLHNGRLTKIGDYPFSEEEYVMGDVTKLMERIRPNNGN